MSMKTYFAYDKETGYILSGFDCVDDNHNDGYNVFTRPYSIPHGSEKCRMDYIYNVSKREGLNSLKYNNLIVKSVDSPFDVKCTFIQNKDYLKSKEAVRGWWKLDNCD